MILIMNTIFQKKSNNSCLDSELISHIEIPTTKIEYNDKGITKFEFPVKYY